MPLGFSDKIRFYVEQNICRKDEGRPQPDCSDELNKAVYDLLNEVTYCRTTIYILPVKSKILKTKQS